MSEDAHELVCSGCGGHRDRGPDQRYCRACKNAYDRRWRESRADELQWRRAMMKGLQKPEQVPRETMDDAPVPRAASST